jgi:hypothetical protein
MKYQWRITKYDPKLRDENGAYTGDDWIMLQQIGKTFNGKKLAREGYLETENRYVQAALAFLRAAGLKSITVQDFGGKTYQPERIEELDLNIDMPIANGQELSLDEADQVIRMLLREIIWCKLVVSNSLFIHIGWDFYMYIGSDVDLPEGKAEAEKLGLFVEESLPPNLMND